MERNQQKASNSNQGKPSEISNSRGSHVQKPGNEKSKKKLIVSYVNEFLQKQSDFGWLTQPFNHVVGSDHFKNLVVRSTFPVNLNQVDFEYYIDMTFNDFPPNLTTRMKDLFQTSNQNPTSDDIKISETADGAVTATLIQILCQKNDRDEIEMLVGSVSLTRRPPKGYYFTGSYWEQHKEQVKTALQYIYGKEAQKEQLD
ncbi:unnamed protein product [Rotaria sp. Silwood2]|nr:unnamed protein product [Rotaria sp. Silwood2]CAF2827929.1 unnamed protein product [Rotaria sp. Silwood2]CAF3566225.1 unnamed protein product [Rotaria sp. Silwood2]CAF4587615.1 unnamed protein product [Rotaria sp. Silwood2]CAF4634976.1 unnamed protein product [Rotaria sp. Silwood2]